jgi:hypothetical protein
MKYVVVFSLVLAFAIRAPAHEESAANEMATAANSLIASFTPDQRAASVFAIDDDHRLDWHFIPKQRKGTSLKEMTPQQRHLMTALLAVSLSAKGLVKTSNIMSLEEVLKRIEASQPRAARDPELYHVSIFGKPGPGKTWGWRFEGHHLSLSFTIVDGLHISSTPSMMGTNPDIVPELLVEPLPADTERLLVSNDHMGNFFECVQARKQPICNAEIGHRSASICHLGFIAMRLSRELKWDPQAESFVNDAESNGWLTREMRSPWGYDNV